MFGWRNTSVIEVLPGTEIANSGPHFTDDSWIDSSMELLDTWARDEKIALRKLNDPWRGIPNFSVDENDWKILLDGEFKCRLF